MVVHAEGRHPRDSDNGGEVREIGVAAEKRGEANCKTRPRCEEGDPARKRARQKQHCDRSCERDVNCPGDHQDFRVRYRGAVSRTTNARMIAMLTFTARSPFNTLDSIA